MEGRIAGIEAGGTKFVCAVGAGPGRIEAEERFPTSNPDETLARVLEFLDRHRPIKAIGIGTFGPCDPELASPTFGHITTTPKPGWTNVDVVGCVRERFDVPIGFDTDVNAAALGEWRWGAAQGLDTFLYLTIGTGIGGGGLSNGRLMHGMVHPEMGHIRIPRGEDRSRFSGICPYHGDCLEGLASGPAIEARWGMPAHQLPQDHAAWEIEAQYLALALQSFICTLSPQRIIMGGGVMEQRHLFARIRHHVRQYLNGYVQTPQIVEHIDRYIVPPQLGNQAGMLGSIALAYAALAAPTS